MAEPADAPLVGREHHLASLDDALAAARAGRTVVMLLHGPSGMGKTALLRRFLGTAETHRARVLEGRSYPRAGAPFEALGPPIEALGDHLGRLPRGEAGALLVPHAAAIARLFPAIARTAAIAEAPALPDGLDPHEVRRRAAAALRALLGGVAARAPIVIALDDMQWADPDSASLLIDLVTQPGAPPLLLIAAYRSEDARSIDLVGALLRRLARGEPAPDVREIFVGPLSPSASRALAEALSPDRGDRAMCGDPAIAAIARAGDGDPFALRELLRHVWNEGPVLFAGTLARRIGALAEPARRLLEAMAVAGRPAPVTALGSAAKIDDPAAALAILRAEQMVIVRSTGSSEEAEVSHDRIREAALAAAAPEALAALHRRLARVLEDTGGADPAVIAAHYDAGGDPARARDHAEIAADRAAHALAFRRAAALYPRAIEGAEGRRPLLVALGHALGRAGRGAEAARAYLAACEGAPPDEALDLRCRAAEALLYAGEVDEGLAVVREVLAAVDLSLPRTPARAYASLLYRRARLSLRGLDFEERFEPASPAERTRIDVAWSVGHALEGVDLVRGADLHARHLYYALEAGDPYRVSRALSSEAILAAMEGGRGGPARAARLLDRARSIAERTGHPHALAWAAGAGAGAAFHEPRFSDAVTLADRAIRVFRSTSIGATWEIGSIVCRWLLPALYYLGRLDDLSHRLPAYLEEAEALGAAGSLALLRALTARLLCARDRPADARAEALDARARWPARGFHAPSFGAMVALTLAALYEGDGVAAHTEVEGCFPILDRSLLLRIESLRIESIYLRGAAAIAAIGSGADPDRPRAIAARAARALGREHGALARPFALALRAAVALSRGQDARAVPLLADAERAFGDLEMGLHAAAARRQRGELLGGDEGRVLCEGSDAWMGDRGVMRPDRTAAMLLPMAWGAAAPSHSWTAT